MVAKLAKATPIRRGFTCFAVLSVIVRLVTAGSTDFIFSGCAVYRPQPESEGRSGDFSATTLQTLFETLKSRASTGNFSRTSLGPVSGLFQCRGDLWSPSDCRDCVAEATKQVKRRCRAANPPAARIQLQGCYLSYEVAGGGPANRDPSGMVYHRCGPEMPSVNSTRSGFGFGASPGVEAIHMSVNRMVNGFFAGYVSTGNGSVMVAAQCEGDMAGDKCKGCVSSAAESLKSSCGSASVSGEMYFEKCYVTYNLNGYTDGSPSSSGEPFLNVTSKSVAILIGFLFGCIMVSVVVLYFMSLSKKDPFVQKY
ncbi:unnamed protein product [Cuscuta campestris]|uniref:Gnk2-homologous domain-containing protein n=1 Tax=Cuscuta campestris TaxID=132261 RepID=A0A484MBY0_9ASTE|nr:unnamed protein product [Cuscuta campestris]